MASVSEDKGNQHLGNLLSSVSSPAADLGLGRVPDPPQQSLDRPLHQLFDVSNHFTRNSDLSSGSSQRSLLLKLGPCVHLEELACEDRTPPGSIYVPNNNIYPLTFSRALHSL